MIVDFHETTLDKVMKFWVDSLKSEKDKDLTITNHEYFYNLATGKVMFKLFVDRKETDEP